MQENSLAQRQREFAEMEKQVQNETDALNEQLERLNIERDAFDRKA